MFGMKKSLLLSYLEYSLMQQYDLQKDLPSQKEYVLLCVHHHSFSKLAALSKFICTRAYRRFDMDSVDFHGMCQPQHGPA